MILQIICFCSFVLLLLIVCKTVHVLYCYLLEGNDWSGQAWALGHRSPGQERWRRPREAHEALHEVLMHLWAICGLPLIIILLCFHSPFSISYFLLWLFHFVLFCLFYFFIIILLCLFIIILSFMIILLFHDVCLLRSAQQGSICPYRATSAEQPTSLCRARQHLP